jgi:hypothetical protein
MWRFLFFACARMWKTKIFESNRNWINHVGIVNRFRKNRVIFVKNERTMARPSVTFWSTCSGTTSWRKAEASDYELVYWVCKIWYHLCSYFLRGWKGACFEVVQTLIKMVSPPWCVLVNWLLLSSFYDHPICKMASMFWQWWNGGHLCCSLQKWWKKYFQVICFLPGWLSTTTQ